MAGGVATALPTVACWSWPACARVATGVKLSLPSSRVSVQRCAHEPFHGHCQMVVPLALPVPRTSSSFWLCCTVSRCVPSPSGSMAKRWFGRPCQSH